MPFSFIVIDNDSRATASLVGTATINGILCDHYQSNRTQGGQSFGQMNWYLTKVKGTSSLRLVRNTFVQPLTSPTPGNSGNRDFSKAWVTPAPASKFAVPKGCKAAGDDTETNAHFAALAAAFGGAY